MNETHEKRIAELQRTEAARLNDPIDRLCNSIKDLTQAIGALQKTLERQHIERKYGPQPR